MTTRADTIARHLSVFETHLRGVACGFSAEERLSSASDAAAALREAFAALDGGAAVAGEAAGPWVVRVVDTLGHASWDPGVTDLTRALRFDRGTADEVAKSWQSLHRTATILPLAEAERMEAEGPPQPAPRFVPVSAPEPPKPAGWVVRNGSLTRWLCIGRQREEDMLPTFEPFATREDAQRMADTTGGKVLPVDAAGNVIEALPGVAWEAARAGEEAERLRGEVARLHETLRDVGALADEHANEWHALLDHARTAADEVCGPQPVISAREAVTLIERKAFDLRTDAERLRTELAAVKAERAAVLSNAAVLDTSLRRLRTDHATTLAERDKWAANAGTLNASLRQVHTECDQLRAELDATLAERDGLAAEVHRAREQKPVHLALVNKQGAVVDGYLIKTRALAEDDARRRACTVAPLYLAPVVRDHSGVIAQCEEALNGDVAVRHALRAALVSALAALRGAS